MTEAFRAPALPVTRLFGVYNGSVIDNNDPEGLARVLVGLPGWRDGHKPVPLWARLATLDAGEDRGSWFVPDVGDEVLVAFVAGDPAQPVVVGSLWNGVKKPHRTMSPENPVRELRTPAGSSLTFEDSGDQGSVRIRTAGGATVELRDAAGGGITLSTGGATVTLGGSGITLQSPGTVKVTAASLDVSAALSSFSGVVKCDTLVTNSVISASYTPGAGNIW